MCTSISTTSVLKYVYTYCITVIAQSKYIFSVRIRDFFIAYAFDAEAFAQFLLFPLGVGRQATHRGKDVQQRRGWHGGSSVVGEL